MQAPPPTNMHPSPVSDTDYSPGSPEEEPPEHIRAKSQIAVPFRASGDGGDLQIHKQTSAPSYLFSLTDCAPPFRKPGKEPRPCVMVGAIMKEKDAIEMVAAADADPGDGLRRYLERNFLVSLMTETMEYSAQRDFNARKLSVLTTLYLATHLYFKWYYWTSPIRVWKYFKELVVRHTIQDSPDGEEVFEPDESYDILTHFHAIYLSNLPLVHILTFGVYRLKFTWPFKKK